MVSVDAKHDVYFKIPSPTLKSLVVSVDVKHTATDPRDRDACALEWAGLS